MSPVWDLSTTPACLLLFDSNVLRLSLSRDFYLADPLRVGRAQSHVVTDGWQQYCRRLATVGYFALVHDECVGRRVHP